MRRIWIALVAALALGFPGLACAQDGEKLDCAIAAVSSDFKASIGAGLTASGNDDQMDPLLNRLRGVTEECAKKWGLDPGTYYDYSLARIGREWMIPALRRWSLDTAIVDKVFDFRMGGSPVDLSNGITREQGAAIIDGFRAAGVDVESVPDDAWRMIGGYIFVTATYWRTRALLTR